MSNGKKTRRPTGWPMENREMQNRRLLLVGAGIFGLVGCATGAEVKASETSSASETKAVEITLLRSIDPNPNLAAQFIKANWFAMDEIARVRGLMTFFNLHIDPNPREDWNLIVQVGYPDVRGFDSIRHQWAEIVAAHQTVLIEGKRLPDLARVLGTRRLLPA
jgi:hypothetical protein